MGLVVCLLLGHTDTVTWVGLPADQGAGAGAAAGPSGGAVASYSGEDSALVGCLLCHLHHRGGGSSSSMSRRNRGTCHGAGGDPGRHLLPAHETRAEQGCLGCCGNWPTARLNSCQPSSPRSGHLDQRTPSQTGLPASTPGRACTGRGPRCLRPRSGPARRRCPPPRRWRGPRSRRQCHPARQHAARGRRRSCRWHSYPAPAGTPAGSGPSQLWSRRPCHLGRCRATRTLWSMAAPGWRCAPRRQSYWIAAHGWWCCPSGTPAHEGGG